MRVSVLIPTWNRAEYLGQAIESVLTQTYQDFELIVVDDGSEDGTEELVKHYERVRYVYQTHAGISAARNLALSEANSEFIAWLDSDDMYVPEKLEKQVAYLDAHSACEIVFCRPWSFSDIQRENMTKRQKQLMDVNKRQLRLCFPTSCMRRILIERYGGFEKKYICGEDTEWIARISAAGVDVSAFIPDPLYLRRIHDTQISYANGKKEQCDYLAIYADAIRRAKKGDKILC